jgi:hypothetical protein
MSAVLHPSDEMRLAAERLLQPRECTTPGPECGCKDAEGFAKLLHQLADDWDGDPTQVDDDECDDIYHVALEAARRINALPTLDGEK